jgi:hypothetical protein
MAEIIKKWKQDGKDMAWVTISDTEAILIAYTKDDTDTRIKGKADIIMAKKERLKVVQARIRELGG